MAILTASLGGERSALVSRRRLSSPCSHFASAPTVGVFVLGSGLLEENTEDLPGPTFSVASEISPVRTRQRYGPSLPRATLRLGRSLQTQ